jgi:hypothetical protein
MPTYRIKFLDGDDNVRGHHDFIAERDASAILIADWLFEACSEVYQDYELWCGPRYFIPLTKMGISGASLAFRSDREEMHSVQEIVIDMERMLLDSAQIIARSRRLMQATAKLETTLAVRRAR